MYEEDLALNNLQWLICHKDVPNQTKPNTLGLVSLLNGISTFVGYLMAKPFSEKNSSGTI